MFRSSNIKRLIIPFAALMVLGGCMDPNVPADLTPSPVPTSQLLNTATPPNTLSVATAPPSVVVVPTPEEQTQSPDPPSPTSIPPTSTADTSDADDPTKLAVEVNVNASIRHPISPWIYGLADSTSDHEEQLQWLGASLVRWGGNARSRHNWEVNASNAGSDWEFRNVSQGDSVPGSASLLFMQRNERLGALSLLTIPTIGWVAKDGDNDSQSINVPEHGGPAVSPGSDTAFTSFSNGSWSQPYDPSDNRARTSIQSLPSKNGPYTYPPDLTDGKVYQDEWVAYLRSQRPEDALPTIYAMDNEPELWSDDTHVDVHPVRLGFDDQLSNFLTYARAVKHADPDGLVAGPESWGVTAYLHSALDDGGDGYQTSADTAAHGGIPWLQWFLRAVREDDEAQGSRSLDILDVHYYPQTGVSYGDNSPDMQDKRMQAPRSLWDTTYIEPSWVARTEWPNLALIRRLQRLIEQNYPGTKIGISEWNFGGEDDISGAIAIADTLGIFGRENVYSAACWCLPQENTPAGWAFRLYRNYDGNGSTFGTESVAVDSTNTTEFSAYAATTEDNGKLTVMLINKNRDKSASVTINTQDFTPGANSMEYGYGPGDLGEIAGKALTSASSEPIRVTMPPMSIKLLVFDN